MSDQSDLTLTPPPQTPLPNDPAARSATGEILEPSQIPPTPPKPPSEAPPSEPTSTPKPEAKPDAPAAPDAYTAFTAPDGYTINAKTIEAATPIFKELGLNQAQAQRLVDFHTAQMIAAAKGPADEYTAMRTEWKAQVEADPVIRDAVLDGKTGVEAVKLGIGKTLAALGDPALAQEFKSAMNLTGAGDNPAFIKAMYKLSSLITEGKHVSGNAPSPHGQTPPNQSARPSPAKALFPNLA